MPRLGEGDMKLQGPKHLVQPQPEEINTISLRRARDVLAYIVAW